MLECNLGTKGLYNSLYNILLHGVTLPSLDSASLSVTELVEYCFRASHPPSEVVVYFLLGKICLSTPEGYIPTFPPAPYPSPSVYLYYSLYLAVFLILFREQNKLSRNQSSVSTCLVVFVRRPTFSLGELHLAHAAKGMRQKGNPFTALSSHKKHNTHTSFCRLVLYQFYLPFNHCNLNTCPFLVSSSSLVENYSLLSHRSMKNILFSILRRETGLNLKLEWYVFAL